ncbi:MAG: hypothetical protein EP318_17940 [Rhodobacteraceae bacterium]|nr:MAG: hypothetical protein EP318_17940 [Paracoccaceae bacterium]
MIRQHAKTAWDSVMNAERNPLRRLPLMTAHMLMQVLAWMWSAIFSVALGSYVFFGISVIGHALIIAGIVVTLAVFDRAEPRGTVRA